MNIYPIVYPTALHFWLNANFASEVYLPKDGCYSALPQGYRLSTVRSNAQILSQKYSLSYPIRLLAPDRGSRITQKELTSSVRSEHIPENSFVRIDNLPAGTPVYMACPEYCFLKAASSLSIYELILLGYRLCAKYVPDNSSQYHQRTRTPITSTARIRTYLRQCKGAHGIKKAWRAISYVLDNSNSPMESIFVMPAILPHWMGGFGLTIRAE